MEPGKNPFEIVESKDIYTNPWISVREDTVLRPGGAKGIFGTITMKPGVTVVPLTESGDIYLVQEYKYAVGAYTVECMSGGIDVGESILEAAQRELREEVGAESCEWLDMGRLDPFTGIILSPNHIFIAQNITFSDTNHSNDPGEIVTTVCIPFEKAFDMAMKGEITHAASVAGILKAHYLLTK